MRDRFGVRWLVITFPVAERRREKGSSFRLSRSAYRLLEPKGERCFACGTIILDKTRTVPVGVEFSTLGCGGLPGAHVFAPIFGRDFLLIFFFCQGEKKGSRARPVVPSGNGPVQVKVSRNERRRGRVNGRRHGRRAGPLVRVSTARWTRPSGRPEAWP